MATDTGFTTSPTRHISDELAANYDAIVADENSGRTYEDIAKQAAEQGDAQTAAWARERADAKTEPEPEPEPPIAYDSLKLDELKAIAADRQIPTDELKLRADFVEALTVWDEAQPAPDRNAAAAAALAAGA